LAESPLRAIAKDILHEHFSQSFSVFFFGVHHDNFESDAISFLSFP
jgi:hypothetical protein